MSGLARVSKIDEDYINNGFLNIDELAKDISRLCRFITCHRETLTKEELEKLYNIIITSNNIKDLITYMRYAANNQDKNYIINKFFEHARCDNYSNLIYPVNNFSLIDFIARYYKYCDETSLKVLIARIFIRAHNYPQQIFGLYKSCKNNDIRSILAENIVKNDMLSLLDEYQTRDAYVKKSIFDLLPESAELGILL